MSRGLGHFNFLIELCKIGEFLSGSWIVVFINT